MKKKSVGFKMGVATALLHLLLFVLAYAAAVSSRDAQAGLVFLPFFLLDSPILLLQALLPRAWAAGSGSPLLLFGVLGTLLWFAIPWLTDRLLVRIFPAARRLIRWIVCAAALPVAIALFGRLSDQAIALSIRRERPEELKGLLAGTAPGALVKRTVLEDIPMAGVCGMYGLPGGPDADGDILVACHRGALRLDSRYATKERVEFATNFFSEVEPVMDGGGFSGRFVVYKLFESVALLNGDGVEAWCIQRSGPSASLDGARCGDIDADGKPDFAVFYRYGEGITLVDEAGQVRWKHPVYALGQIAMADVRGNGRAEILFSNSNNANRNTVFTTLDAEGRVVGEMRLSTDSSEFALVRWPDLPARPNLLLTEENRIRIVDPAGNDILRLEAPGCRSWGAVAAVPVTFRGGAAAGLAVRKILHPDLAALFVYDAEGKLLFQDAEILQGPLSPAIAAVPGESPGTERLLVGADGARVVEYVPAAGP